MIRKIRRTKTDALTHENASKWLSELELSGLKGKPRRLSPERRKRLRESKAGKIERETAQVWIKEALFQDLGAKRYLEMKLEMEGLNFQQTALRFTNTFKRKLVNDRRETKLERYSDETLFYNAN